MSDRTYVSAKRVPHSGMDTSDAVRPPRPAVTPTAVSDHGMPRGRALDGAIRAYMEPRFGHDFSQVRIHAGPAAHASASAHGALAFTAGQDVVFGAGQYRPDTVAGRWLIAHELAHVIQQSTSGGDGGTTTDSALERVAGHAALSVALGAFTRVPAAPQVPSVQLATPDQGFSQALDDFAKTANETAALALLRTQSTTFRALAKTLDAHYVWFKDPAFDPSASSGSTSRLQVDDSGRVTNPRWAAGRRALWIVAGESSFRPFGDPDNLTGSDLIILQLASGFIQAIAHEATHARAFVTGGGKPPATLPAAIAAGIADEIAARTSEAKILSEIKNPAARKQFQPVGSLHERDVQRDISPAFNLTYLENDFFAWELQQAQAREKLSDDLARQIRETVDRDPSAPPPLLRGNRLEYSDYARTWFARQAVVREWKEFAAAHRPDDADFVSERETLLQDHAKRYFRGKVSYLP